MLSGLLRRITGRVPLPGRAQSHDDVVRPSADDTASVLEAARALWAAGRQDDAVAVVETITRRDDAPAEALKLHGRWAGMRGYLPLSRRLFQQATGRAPSDPDAWLGLGTAVLLSGDPAGAAAHFRRAHALAPGERGIVAMLARCCHEQGDSDGAVAWMKRAVEREPGSADVWTDYAAYLRAALRWTEAEDAYLRALASVPEHTGALDGLGMLYCEQARFEEAAPFLERATALPDAPPTALANLAVVCRSRGHLTEAIALAERAASRGLRSPEARMEHAMLLLAAQRYAEGWALYESRFEVPGYPSPVRSDGGVRWRGEPVTGKTVLLWAEQGLGDTFQFVRYAQLLTERGATVVIEAQPPAVRLLSGSGLGEAVRPTGADWRDVSPDFHCPMMSLPYAFGTTFDTIPSPGAYLGAREDPRFADPLRAVPGLRVGFVWAGNPQHRQDATRSMSWKTLSALADLPGVVPVPLQMGDAGGQWRPGARNGGVDLRAHIQDFADTAALVAQLDVVVTVDTAVAHLAAAMGRETCVLLPFPPEWRWWPGPDRTPWYPSVTLFSCDRPGHWTPVIERVAAHLTAHVT